jgi:hypothetical protein
MAPNFKTELLGKPAQNIILDGSSAAQLLPGLAQQAAVDAASLTPGSGAAAAAQAAVAAADPSQLVSLSVANARSMVAAIGAPTAPVSERVIFATPSQGYVLSIGEGLTSSTYTLGLAANPVTGLGTTSAQRASLTTSQTALQSVPTMTMTTAAGTVTQALPATAAAASIGGLICTAAFFFVGEALTADAALAALTAIGVRFGILVAGYESCDSQPGEPISRSLTIDQDTNSCNGTGCNIKVDADGFPVQNGLAVTYPISTSVRTDVEYSTDPDFNGASSVDIRNLGIQTVILHRIIWAGASSTSDYSPYEYSYICRSTFVLYVMSGTWNDGLTSYAEQSTPKPPSTC